MKLLAFLLLVSTLVLAAGSGAIVQADNIPFIDLYETTNNTPTGTPSEIGPVVSLPFLVAVGSGTFGTPVTGDLFIVLLESDNANAPNNHAIGNWSDVIKITNPLLDSVFLTQIDSFDVDEQYIGLFTDTNLVATAQLFSDPEFSLVSGEITPAGSNVIWVAEGPSERTVIAPFNVYSDPPGPGDTEAVPEPSTFLLVGAGIVGAGLLRKKMTKVDRKNDTGR